MTAFTRGARLVRCRTTLCMIAAGVSAGCAAGLADRASSPAEAPRLLYHPGEAPSDGTVTLRPERIAAGSGVARLSDVRLYLGGVGSLDADDEAASERLALVFQAARDSAGSPVLHRYRRLLLEIDGSLFRSSSLVDARLYRYAFTELGYTETVLVPIDRPTLERLTEAEVVRGRVGDWISFELSPEDIDELRGFLNALPEVDRTGPPVRPVGRPTGWIGG